MKTDPFTFERRIGPDPHANGKASAGGAGCPDIWELSNGDFAFIGINHTHAKASLPATAGCGDDERIVRVPRDIVLGALRDFPQS